MSAREIAADAPPVAYAQHDETLREAKALYDRYFETDARSDFDAFYDFIENSGIGGRRVLFCLVAAYAQTAALRAREIAIREEAERDPLAFLSGGELSSLWTDPTGPTARKIDGYERLIVELEIDAREIVDCKLTNPIAREVASAMRQRIDDFRKAVVR